MGRGPAAARGADADDAVDRDAEIGTAAAFGTVRVPDRGPDVDPDVDPDLDVDVDGDLTAGTGPVPAAASGAVSGPADPDEVRPLGLEPQPPSGDAVVDRAVQRLTQADVLPTDRHAEVYEDVHRELREVLTGLDR